MENKAASASKTPVQRSPNFGPGEKQLLFSLVDKYKNIIENKKTDAVTSEEKNRAWIKVGDEFNALCPAMTTRTATSLKKLYTNSKKQLKKEVAEENRQRFKTGGGAAIGKPKEGQELLMSIVHEKSLYGINNPHDGDYVNHVPRNTSTSQLSLMEPAEITLPLSGHDDGKSNEENNTFILATDNWGDPKATMLTMPISAQLDTRQKTVCTKTQDKGNKEPNSTKNNCSPTNNQQRRRPLAVNPLTSSHVGEKYDELLDHRLAIASIKRRRLEEKLTSERELLDLQKRSVMLDIEIKEHELKKVKSSSNY